MKVYKFGSVLMLFVSLGSALLLLLSLGSGSALAGTNSGIAPIDSTPYGHSYSEWAAAWWQWALGIPASVNPLLDTTGANCAKGQTDRVWFLAGTPGTLSTEPITRQCIIPRNRALFFPLINYGYFAFLNDPPETRTEAFIRSQVVCVEDATFSRVEIDGVAVNNPQQYLEKSVLFDVRLPKDNLFGAVKKESPDMLFIPKLMLSPSVDEGFYLFVFPLTSGQHTIRWQASACGGAFSQDITYNLTVK